MTHVPDPYTRPSEGIMYADPVPKPDLEAPDAGDPVSKPEFYEHCVRRLVEVRNALSELFNEQYGVNTGRGIPAQDRLTVAKFERDESIRQRRIVLEREENELVAKINQFRYVASLGDAAIENEDTYTNEALGAGD